MIDEVISFKALEEMRENKKSLPKTHDLVSLADLHGFKGRM